MRYQQSLFQNGSTTAVIIGIVAILMLAQCKTASTSGNRGPIRTLMVGGGSSHDFDRWYKQEDAQALQRDGLASVTYISNTDSILHYLPATDVLFLSNNQPIANTQARQAIIDFAKAGKGLVLAHPAIWYNWRDWPEYNHQLVSGGTRSHDRYGSFTFNVKNPSHPVMQGVEQQFTLKDELYHFRMDSTGSGIEVLAESYATDPQKRFPSIFVVKHPNARIVGVALGHDAESHTLPQYQQIIRNAVKWAARKD